MEEHWTRFWAAVRESCRALDVKHAEFRRKKALPEFGLDAPRDADPVRIAELAIESLWDGTDDPHDLVVLVSVVTFLSRSTGRFRTIDERKIMLEELDDLLSTPGRDMRDVRDWITRNYCR